MRFVLICIASIGVFFASSLYAGVLSADLSYDLTRTNDHSILTIKVTFSDDDKSSRKPSLTTNKSAVPAADFTILRELWNSVQSNTNIGIYLNKPDYVQEILGLIENPKNWKKANDIWLYNNSYDAIRLSHGLSVSIINGVQETHAEIGYIIPLTIKRTTILLINSISFQAGNGRYKTNSVSIKLNS